MKMKFRGAEIELTVEELKQMIDIGILDDEHWDKNDPWQKLIDESTKSTKSIPKNNPFTEVVAVYGCQMPDSWETPFYQQDHTGAPHLTTTEVTALNVTSVEKIDKEKEDEPKE